MNIVFFCQSCGARFEVPPASAGKKGRCRHCSQLMTVPRAQELASMVALPAISADAAKSRVPAAPGEVQAGGSLSWLAAASTDVGLSPLTADSLPVAGSRRLLKPGVDDDLGDSKPYALAEPIRPASSRPAGGLPSRARILWRKIFGRVEKLFRNLNQLAYLISVPFLVMILVGAVIQSRHLALMGATAVVLLNLGRIITGVANLAVVPFREGISQGIQFLIPPLTFFYLANHWNRLRKPTLRIVEPIVTMTLVLLAFTFVPTLRKDGKVVGARNLPNEIRSEAKSLEGEMIGEVRKARSLDLESLKNQARETLGDAAGKINSIGQPGPSP